MVLFPYYPSKTTLITIYMKNQHLLYDGSEAAFNSLTGMACQILTSYKLVKYYALNNKEGLSSKMKLPTKTKKLTEFLLKYYMDLNFISDCSEDTPYVYWKMHIQGGMENIFGYY